LYFSRKNGKDIQVPDLEDDGCPSDVLTGSGPDALERASGLARVAGASPRIDRLQASPVKGVSLSAPDDLRIVPSFDGAFAKLTMRRREPREQGRFTIPLTWGISRYSFLGLSVCLIASKMRLFTC